MDWRNGNRPNASGSAFRGISTRGRGKGRGRGGSPGVRGGSPIILPEAPSTPQPPVSLPAQLTTAPPTPHVKTPFHRTPHQPPRRAPSLPHLDISKSSSTDTATAPGGRPQSARRGSHNPPSAMLSPIPSIKVDPSASATPSSPRSKSSRKRSHNRTRSSSKASTQGQLSTAPSVASLREQNHSGEQNKEILPYTALGSAPPNVQSFELRSNIDTLVERVRAMAMAGSAIDKDKDKLGRYTPSEGHIDWAGDEDDTLPDLDDWVKPKVLELKEKSESVEKFNSTEKPTLSPVEEVVTPGLPVPDIGKNRESRTTSNMSSGGRVSRTENATDTRDTRTHDPPKDKEIVSGRIKSRGRHGRKKSSTSEINASVSPAKPASQDTTIRSTDSSVPAKSLTQTSLVHPLPPKPQLSTATSTHGLRSRGSARSIQIETNRATGETSPDHDSVQRTTNQEAVVTTDAEVDTVDVLSEEPVEGRSNEPGIGSKSASPRVESLYVPSVPSLSSEVASETQPRKRAFDPTVDWANAPRTTLNPPPSRRSPTRPVRSPASQHVFSSPQPHTAPPFNRSGDPYTSHNSSPRLPPSQTLPPHTRSQMNSPERRSYQPRNLGATHFRAHSSPQTGPGTRTHSTRPVITFDALSRISRTLGVPAGTTPPARGHSEVSVVD